MPEQPSGAEIAPLPILGKVFAELAAHGIACCHWKSNAHLAEAAKGETDLDLLVERSKADEFSALLARHGFKPLDAAPGKDYPGVENHLGYDEDTGRLVHLHVHYDLVLGQQHVKDYRLPIEGAVLESVVSAHGVPIPAARLELIILAVRAVLKYRLRDALKDVLGIRSPGIPGHIRREAQWLLERTSLPEVEETLRELGPMVPAGLVLEIIGLLTAPRVRGPRLLIARERMRQALRPMQRLPRWRATIRYLTALWRRQARSAGVTAKRRMTLRNGGASIAFVGSDGAGKTTVVSAVEDWLSWRLDCGSYYMGIPEPTGARWVLKRASRVTRAAHRRVTAASGSTGAMAATTRALSQATLGIRRVVEAGSRVRRARRAQRRIDRGGVALFDRYPLPSVAVFGRAMDGARLEEELEKPWSPLATRLMTWERARYDRIPPPRHIVALNVTAAESLRRKPDHDADSIVAKTAAIRTSAADGSDMAVVDADRDIDHVLADVKARIWTWL